ncbi:phage terminase large subunit family protein [Selenomonadales bacterium OttesenSCG-928-I06]|nr:phage terminase large subunit family protein [Selenomonadales bacterium OttesenSCG-928-I06]
MKKTIDLFKKLAKKYLAPIPRMTVSEWADTYRVISKGNAYEGRWRTSFAPYQKPIMDSFTQSGVNKIVVMSASQIGKSDIMNNAIGRFSHLDPCPMMMVQPTIATAEDYSKSRISPMIRDSKVLSNIFSDPKSRNSSSTILSKMFPGGRLIITGSNSPSELASRPIRILLCDEVDRFEASAGTEGSPIALAEKRLTTFWNKLTALFSTPTIKGFSRIETEYMLGTQEEWQHECPNCKEYHLLNYRDMEWDAEEIEMQDQQDELLKIYLVKDVKWQCPDCGFSFSEETMKAQPQKYVSKNPEAIKNQVRSFRVNGFTPVWISWKDIIKEYLEAQHDENDLKVVFNTRFAESYEVKGAVDSIQPFLEAREEYDAELQEGVLLLTAVVDTQDNRLEYEICGWGEDEEQWGIEKGIILGVPDQQATWDKLDEVLDKTYRFVDGKGLKVARTFIDSGGHYTEEVYRYCLKNYHKQRIAIKGSSNFSAPLIEKYSKPQNYNIPLVLIGVSQGKQYIFERLLKEDKGDRVHKLHFPLNEDKGYNKAYFKGLVSERLVKKKVKGRITLVWENVSTDGRNEPLDLKVYGLACLKSLNPNWSKYREVLQGETKTKKIKPKTKEEYGVVSTGGGWMDA